MLTKLKECPNCKSTIFEPYRDALSKPKGDSFMVEVFHYDICAFCGIIFQNPRMASGEIFGYYASGKYRNSLLTEEVNQEQVDNKEGEDAARYEQYVHQFKSTDPKKVLDLGCSRGYFLWRMKNRYDSVTCGVEPNLEYVKERPDRLYAHLEEIPDGNFNLITAFHVLEHVLNPRETVKKLIEKLAPGGMLMIEVPNELSPGSPYRQAHLYFIQPWVAINWIRDLSFRSLMFTPHTFIKGVK